MRRSGVEFIQAPGFSGEELAESFETIRFRIITGLAGVGWKVSFQGFDSQVGIQRSINRLPENGTWAAPTFL
jgi:hypothetical protein